jgi:hypothetical protein
MYKTAFSLVVLAIFLGASVSAQGLTPRDTIYTFNTAIDRVDKLVDGSNGVLAAEHVTRMTTEAKARFAWRDDAGSQLFVEPFVRRTHFQTVEDDFNFGVFAEFRHQLSDNEKGQLRWRAGLEQSQDTFTRFTSQVMLNTRHSKSLTSQSTLRYRYRDQNDAQTFSGFDQHELLMSFQQVWKPADGPVNRISNKVYGDFRQADADQFDYAEFGIALQARYEPQRDWALTAKAKGFVRQYGDAFSSDYNFARQDRRLTVDLEARYDLGGGQTILGAAGWATNRSNIKTRAFSGATFQLAYEIDLN